MAFFLTTEIDVIKNKITSAIEQMTMQGINLKTLDISKATMLNEEKDLSSEDGFLREYKQLSIQLKQLQIIEKRSHDQIGTLKKTEMSNLDDIERFRNLDVCEFVNNMNNMNDIFRMRRNCIVFIYQAHRTDAVRRLDELQAKLDDIKHKKRVTKNVIEEAQLRNDDLKNQLKNNDTYRHISHLEERLTDFMEENRTLQEALDQMRKVSVWA